MPASRLLPGQAGARPGSEKRPRFQLIWLGLLIILAVGGWKTVREARVKLGLIEARNDLRSYRPEAAVERLKSVLSVVPDCAEGEFLLAVAERRVGALSRVEPHLTRAEELGWNPKAVERQRYLNMFQAGDFERAGAYVKRLFDQGGTDDDAEEVCECMIRGYYAGLRFREARLVVKYWTAWQPENPQPYLLRADEAVLVNEGSAEIAACREILRFAPSHYDTRRRLAQALIEQHDFGEAFELLASCERERPDDPAVLIALASCLEQQGQYDESRRNIEAALGLPISDLQRAMALEVKARVATAVRDHGEAARLMKQVVALAPGIKAYVYELGQALHRAGRGDEAKESMREWQRLTKIEARLDEIRDALLKAPDDPDLRCEVGTLHMKKGGHEVLGVNWLLSAVIRDANHREAHEALAEYYRSVGQAALADKHLAAIKSNNAQSPAGQGATAGKALPAP